MGPLELQQCPPRQSWVGSLEVLPFSTSLRGHKGHSGISAKLYGSTSFAIMPERHWLCCCHFGRTGSDISTSPVMSVHLLQAPPTIPISSCQRLGDQVASTASDPLPSPSSAPKPPGCPQPRVGNPPRPCSQQWSPARHSPAEPPGGGRGWERSAGEPPYGRVRFLIFLFIAF